MSKNKPRILHFIESEGVYGAERVILNLSHELRISGSYIPVVGCITAHNEDSCPLYNTAISQGFEATKIPIANSRLFRDINRAAKQIRDLNIDLIHSHGYKPSVFGFIIKLLTRIPIIATCHLWFEPANGPIKMRVMIRLEKFFYRWFPKIIAVSEPIKETLLKCGLSSKQVELVPNGVEVPTEHMTPDETGILRKSLCLDDTNFIVLNSARLTRQKAQWILIKAAAILKQQLPEIRILIVGEGSLADELQAQIKRDGVEEQVQLLGFRSDIQKLLELSNIFVLPSIDEGMPMSLLEAAAANKPIISTLVGDIGKLIQHEKTGIVIPIENPAALAAAITRLKSSYELSKQIAGQAHDAMRINYSSKAMCSRYIMIYNEIIHPIH